VKPTPRESSSAQFSEANLIGITNQFVGDRASIIVTVAGNAMDTDVDWRSGRWRWESLDILRLIPYIDSHFRTIADRAHRAIAGDSFGGWIAMHDAARHPDLFVAAASFSGVDNLTLGSPAEEIALSPLLGMAATHADEFEQGEQARPSPSGWLLLRG
jgi:S-formylglutathione hydrolase FrmB